MELVPILKAIKQPLKYASEAYRMDIIEASAKPTRIGEQRERIVRGNF